MSDFHYYTIICDSDIIICNSDSLLKLLGAVISKLSIQIIWTSDFVSFFIILKKDKSYKIRYDLCLDIIYMFSVLICFGVYNIILS